MEAGADGLPAGYGGGGTSARPQPIGQQRTGRAGLRWV